MKKFLLAMILAASPAFAGEEKLTKGFYTMDAMGCMLLRECTKDVQQVFNITDIANAHPDSDYGIIVDEFHDMLSSLNRVGVKVFLADEKYFPVGHRGVYHTVGNNFFLNKTHMRRPGVLMSVMRHEGWHVAQDCMAGTIENSLIAIIKPEEEVPMIWREMVKRTYPKNAQPWEAEATWAGKTEGMTAKALEACATGAMWEVYKPTPLTRQYLEKEGYLSK
jgi:glycogen synthase